MSVINTVTTAGIKRKGTDSADQLSGGAADDTLEGAGGNDKLYGRDGNDILIGGLSLADEDHYFQNLNEIGGGRDTLYGGAGNDSVIGGGDADRLYGESGDDQLHGGHGVDTLSGGSGRDEFLFFTRADSGVGAGNRDIVTDFAAGVDKLAFEDRITGGSVAVIGQAGFTGAGGTELRYSHRDGKTIVQLDTDRDRRSDFEIELNGTITLSAADIVTFEYY